MSTALCHGPRAGRVIDFPAGNEAGDWHEWRAGGIGASEAAAALGVSPYEDATPLALYLRKTGQAPPVAENDAMWWGREMEPVLLKRYARDTGRSIRASQVAIESADRPFLRATLDAVADDGRPVELKTAGARSADLWGEPGTDEVPEHYLCQVHQQLIVTGAPEADLAVLIGGQDFRVYTVAADPDLHAAMVDRLADFWGRVERRDPPPPSGTDWGLISRLRPTRAATIDLDEEAARIASEYRELTGRIKADEARKVVLRGMLVDRMGEHERATLPDGRSIVRKVSGRREYTVAASTVVTLHIKEPKGV